MDSLLRDLNRESSKMQSDVANLRRHYEQWQGYMQQYLQQSVVEWAKLIVSHPQSLLLVVETTPIVDQNGYASSGEHEPIRFTALSLASGEIYDQLLHPTHSSDVRGSEYHGLLMSDVVDRPCIADVWPAIAKRLEDHHVVVFGLDWTRSALRTVIQTHLLDHAFDLHNKSKEYYGEFYELSLARVLSYQGIDKTREDLKDSRDRVLMLAQVLHNLAAGMEKQVPESGSTDSGDDNLGDLDSQPF